LSAGTFERLGGPLFALTLCALLIAPVLARDDDKVGNVIDFLKSYPVSKIESGTADPSLLRHNLPEISFEKWLGSIMGDSPLEWQGGDCAEYTGDDGYCGSFLVTVRTPQWRCPGVELRFVVGKDATVYLIHDGGNVSDFGARGSLDQLSDLERVLREVKAKAAPNRPPSLPAASLKTMTKAEIIRHVQALDVHRLDSSLPSERFDRWLGRTAHWPLQWWNGDVHERCGPNALEVHVTTAGIHDPEGREPRTYINVVLGSWERGIEGEPKLAISFKGEDGVHVQFSPVKNLSELQKKFDEWHTALLMRKPKVPVVHNMTSIGRFDQVRSSPTGHCYGHSLDFWEYGERVFGLHHRHDGLCGDPPCSAIQNLKFDPKTGELEFLSSQPGEKYKFAGKMESGKIFGVFGAEPVSLRRSREYSTSLDSERNVAAWCTFWSQVPRCSGVKELCKSMGVPEAPAVR